MTQEKPRVLVFGDDTRSFLTTVRSLGRQGLEVHVAPYSFRAAALSSRHIAKVHRIPYYLDGGAAWLEATLRVVASEKISFIIACEERSILPLMRHRAEFGDCVLAIPEEPAFTAFFDKLATHRLAEAANVPAPKAMAVCSSTPISAIEAVLPYPVVCKLCQSYSWADLYARTKICIAQDRTELATWLAQCPPEPESALVEAYFSGFGLGVSVLCQRGEVMQAFEHHRVNEMEGSSYYRVSRPVNADRLAAVRRMAAAVHYTGLAMFEFKADPTTGRWVLLEVNARPWGSLPLPVALGIDFPFWLYQVLTQGACPPQRPYADGVCARNLLADFHQTRMQMSAAPSRAQAARIGLAWAGQSLRILGPKEHWDTLTRDDPRPAWTEFAQLIKGFAERLLPDRWSAPRTAAPTLAWRQPSDAQPQRPLRVLFVCLGNICRSPYAEQRARALALASGASVEFQSAGTLPRGRRPSPDQAIAAAARRGIDLRPHRSLHADLSQMDDNDVVVYFDRAIRQAILDRYPDHGHKLVHVGDLAPEVPAQDVLDPHGRTDAIFDATYAAIDRSMMAWPLLVARAPA
jgi:protein-tyrosine-phosphatase/predicted ATP-grasp superfamily ATP-dependent carboligase